MSAPYATSSSAATVTTPRWRSGAVPVAGGLSRSRRRTPRAATGIDAIRRLAGGGAEPWVLKARVRPMVKRLAPDFDEAALRFTSFSALVDTLGGQIARRQGSSDHELAVRADLPAPSLLGAAPEAAVADTATGHAAELATWESAA